MNVNVCSANMVLRASLFVSIALASFFSHGSARAAGLEPVMTPPPTPSTVVRPLSDRWVEVELPERPFDAQGVTNVGAYSITSTDDANFGVGGVAPTDVQRRFWPEQAPYTDSLSAKNVAAI